MTVTYNLRSVNMSRSVTMMTLDLLPQIAR
jgi:hypothetical protein